MSPRSHTLAVPIAIVMVTCDPRSRGVSPMPVERASIVVHEHRLTTRPARVDASSGFAEFAEARLRPFARTVLVTDPPVAGDIDAFDEVPDSSWFTLRAPSPEEVARGPCPDDATPRAPLTIIGGKQGGATTGLVVRDALGRRYVLKLDQLPQRQPGVTTGSDAVVSRLYWAVGFNTPCNVITYVLRDDFVDDGSDPTFSLDHFLHQGTRRAHDGRVRLGASLFVDGDPLGPWSPTGVRSDDANDVIPHEDRRELRGERLLAAWVNHWDVRGANSLDTFESSSGLVRHYMLDFGDSLGAFALDSRPPEQLGYRPAVDPLSTAFDHVTFGRVHRPWQDLRRDRIVPALGYFEAEHFDPSTWITSRPSVRFANATPQDIGWMARRIARLSPAHVRAAVSAASFDDAAHTTRLTDILLARRERALRWGFANSSPLADVGIVADTVCATDLAPDPRVRYRAWTRGDDRTPRARPIGVAIDRASGATRVCTTVRTPDDVAGRDPTVEVVRLAANGTETRLHVHVRDEGPARGLVVVAIER